MSFVIAGLVAQKFNPNSVGIDFIGTNSESLVSEFCYESSSVLGNVSPSWKWLASWKVVRLTL